jgi:hypothetical protein
MGEELDRFMNLDIPEELHLSRNIQTIAARYTTGQLSEAEYLPTMLVVLAGNVMKLEDRLVALEGKAQS